MNEDKYQPCPCGSGRKLKFCCYEKSSSLSEVSDNELIRRAAEFPVCRCLTNPGWEEMGVAQIFVVRQMPNLKYLVGVYLVDVFCLGVKDTFVRCDFGHKEFNAFLRRSLLQFHEVDYEHVRSIVLGATEYARQLGFEPHEDWANSKSIIESERPFDRKVKFGNDGGPFYIQGPYDDAKKIMARLAPLVKQGKAHYLTLAEVFDDGFGDESPDERYDQIRELMLQKSFEKARHEIEDMFEEFPGCWEPFFLMGCSLLMEDRVEEAIELLNRAISLEPSPEAYYNLATAHRTLFHMDEYVRCLRRVIELGGKKNEFGKMAKAELDGFSSSLRKTSGLTLDQYLENKDRFDRAFDDLGAGRLENAIRGFNEVLKVDPRHVQSHGNLGLAYAALGNRDSAVRHLDMALALDPEYQPAIDNRRILVALADGERPDPHNMRQIEFYAERARAQRAM